MSLTRCHFPDGLTPDAIAAIEAEVENALAADTAAPTFRLTERYWDSANGLDNVRTLRPRTTAVTVTDTEAEAA